MTRRLRTLLFAVTAAATLGAAGCDLRPEDYGRVRASSRAFGDNWARRADELRQRQSALAARAAALPPQTPGGADALARLNGLKADIDGLGTRVQDATNSITSKIEAKQRRLAEQTLMQSDRDLGTTLATITRGLDEVGTQLDGIETQAKADAAAAAPKAPASVADPAFARQGGSAELAGVAFTPGTATIDLRAAGSKPALDQLVAFANRCPELRFSIVGHTANDGDARLNARLSGAQAEAVAQYLVKAGIPAERIAQTGGAGGTQPLVPEPAAGSPEEKAMDTAALAGIRAQNRRLTINVLAPCPASPPS